MATTTIELNFVPLTSEEVPIAKDLDLGGKIYTFEFLRNERFDFYTVQVKDADGAILYTTRLTYGNKLIHAVVSGLDYTIQILPIDPQELITAGNLPSYAINEETLDDVRLYAVPV